jgi:hypothetical protein
MKKFVLTVLASAAFSFIANATEAPTVLESADAKPAAHMEHHHGKNHHHAMSKEEMTQKCKAHTDALTPKAASIEGDDKADFDYYMSDLGNHEKAIGASSDKGAKKHFHMCEQTAKKAEALVKKAEKKKEREEKKAKREAEKEAKKKEREEKKAHAHDKKDMKPEEKKEEPKKEEAKK